MGQARPKRRPLPMPSMNDFPVVPRVPSFTYWNSAEPYGSMIHTWHGQPDTVNEVGEGGAGDV